MPPTSAPYQRVLIDGIPYWKDADGAIYYYERSTPPTSETRIQLGTQADGLRSDWQPLLSSALNSYRAAAQPRLRAAAGGTGTAASGAAAAGH